jgi:flagellar protein FliS
MQPSVNKQYQQGDLLSAAPQRLQFLLVDGAVRFAKQAGEHWRQSDYDQGGEAMDRCEAILTEILTNIKKEHWEVAHSIAALYLFLRKLATEAHLGHDQEKLARLVAVLEIERETWRVLCERPMEQSAPQAGPIVPDAAHASFAPHFGSTLSSAGLSLEA